MKEIDRKAETLRKDECRFFGVDVKFWGSGPNMWQLEVPEAKASKAKGDHTYTSQRKGFKRFITEELEHLR